MAGLPEYRFRVQLGTNGSARTSTLLKLGRLTGVNWSALSVVIPEPDSSNCEVSFAPGQRVGLVAKATNLLGFKANFTLLMRQEAEDGTNRYTEIDQLQGVPFISSGSGDMSLLRKSLSRRTVRIDFAVNDSLIGYQILATDVDSESVKLARNGVYLRKELSDIPPQFLSDHWSSGRGDIADYVAERSHKSPVRYYILS